jgi:uncharacterized membrane protein
LGKRVPSLNLVTSSGNLHLLIPERSMAMKRVILRKILSAAAMIGGSIVAASALAQSQGGYGPGNGMGSGGMMGGYGAGWMGGGGYGGFLLPVLLIVVVAGLVAWIVAQKRK